MRREERMPRVMTDGAISDEDEVQLWRIKPGDVDSGGARLSAVILGATPATRSCNRESGQQQSQWSSELP